MNNKEKLNCNRELEKMIIENEKKEGVDKLTNQEIANKFNCTEATIRNIKKDIKTQNEIEYYKNEIIFWSYHLAKPKDKVSVKDILIQYFCYDKNIYSFSTITSKKIFLNEYKKSKKINDISKVSQETINKALSYFYDYIVKKAMKNKEAGILYRKIRINTDENFVLESKKKIYKSLYNKSKKFIKNSIKVNEKSIIQQNYENKCIGYYIAFLLNVLLIGLKQKNLDKIKYLEKRYNIPDNGNYSFQYLNNFNLFEDFKSKNSLTEKEILIVLSHLTLEIFNMKSLNQIKNFIVSIEQNLTEKEKMYINSLKYDNSKEERLVNKKFKQLNENKINDVSSLISFLKLTAEDTDIKLNYIEAIDKGENVFGYFAFKDKYTKLKNTKLYECYCASSIHKILYTILSADLKEIKKNFISSKNDTKEVLFYYKIPTFIFNYMSKNHFKNLKGCISKMDSEILFNNITEREYFKKVLCLKEDIPVQYDTFEKLLNYVHKLDFKLDGTYNTDKELELALNLTEREILKKRGLEIIEQVKEKNKNIGGVELLKTYNNEKLIKEYIVDKNGEFLKEYKD